MRFRRLRMWWRTRSWLRESPIKGVPYKGKSYYCGNEGCHYVLHSVLESIRHLHYEHGTHLIIHKGEPNPFIHYRLSRKRHA